ncbi:MAG: cation-translocating P-type ATPase [Candidatus Lambdaproteobacteria bacterium]|nr:cation-translocating P-type ATPase [Candidatus Lambdaproteobacteria bacterium]
MNLALDHASSVAAEPTGGDAALSIDLPLTALHCATGAARARQALLRLGGVETVGLSPLTALATLHLGRDGARLREIKAALRRAGVNHGDVVHGAGSAEAQQWRAAEARRATRRVLWGLPVLLPVWLLQAMGAVPGAMEPPVGWLGSAAGPEALPLLQGLLAAALLGLHARMLWQGVLGLLRGVPGGASLATLASGGAWLWGALLLSIPDVDRSTPAHAGWFFAASAALLWLHGFGGALFFRARQALWARVDRLRALQPRTAQVVGEDGLVELPVAELRSGDCVRVGVGQRIPADGEVVEGASRIAAWPFASAALALERRTGEPVLAGTRNLSAPLTVRVGRPEHGTALRALLAWLDAALGAQAPAAPRDELLGAWSARLIVGLGVLVVLAAWMLGAEPSVAVARGLALLAAALPATLAWPAALAGALALLGAVDGGRLIAGGGAAARLAAVDLLVVPREALTVPPAGDVATAPRSRDADVPASAVQSLQALGRLGVEVLLHDDPSPSPHTRLLGIGADVSELGDLAALEKQGRRIGALHLAQGGPGDACAAAQAWLSCGADGALGGAKASAADALLLWGGLERLPGVLRRARATQRVVRWARVLGPACGLGGALLAALWPGMPHPALAALAATAIVGVLLGLAALAGRRRDD